MVRDIDGFKPQEITEAEAKKYSGYTRQTVDRYCYPVLNRYIVADTQLYGWAGVDGETGVKIDLRKVTSDSDEYEIVCTFPETV